MIPFPVIDKDIYLVGLCSETGPGSGKSYVAERLVKEINDRDSETHAYRTSFAKLLKLFTGKILKTDAEEAKFKASHVLVGNFEAFTGREFLIRIGESARSVFGPNFWIEQLANQVEDSYEAQLGLERGKVKSIVIIDDVRYKNEAEWIRSNSGFLINVFNPNHKEGAPTRDSGDVCFKGMTRCINDKNLGEEKFDTIVRGLAAGILVMADIKRKAL